MAQVDYLKTAGYHIHKDTGPSPCPLRVEKLQKFISKISKS
jgi:hypothetical protein